MMFRTLRQVELEMSISASGKQCLAGPQKGQGFLKHVDDDNLEISILDYPRSNFESACSHSRARQYHYVLKGMTEYFDLDHDTIHRFCRGDFYVIDPGTRYAQRIKKDSRVLFVKAPADDDGVDEPADETMLAWSLERLRVERIDPVGVEAPPANSMIPAAGAAVLDSEGNLLMVHRRDSGKWTMPGGAMEMDDSLASCIRREVFEETAIHVSVAGIIGTYTDPAYRAVYSDGEVRRECTILFHCHPTAGDLAIDDESTEARWVPLETALDLPMAASQRGRVEDVLSYIRTGAVVIR